MAENTTLHLVWFRHDLRLADNPAWHAAVTAAAAHGGGVIPVYLLDEHHSRPLGGAHKWWLHHSVAALTAELAKYQLPLILRRGDAGTIIPQLIEQTGATTIHWNRRYDASGQAIDRELKELLRHQGLTVTSYQANLLFEPWDLTTEGGGQPFKVFTPFWKAALKRLATLSAPLPAPTAAVYQKLTAAPQLASDNLASWALLPGHRPNPEPNWAKGWESLWLPGEAGAQQRLKAFLAQDFIGYATGRDFPAKNFVSRLSPHLHHGELSPRQLLAAVTAHPKHASEDARKLLSELGWREFAHHLLGQFPKLGEQNWRAGFDYYPWRDSPADLHKWQRGLTGIPMVDAGMRQLWQTGWMHNRVRLITGSFLVKHLQLDWRLGEQWFWDCLVDGDLASNASNWQWVAGSGADAAPYFRVFNPVEQGKRFDPDATYIKHWCPELAKLPAASCHAPWEAGAAELKMAGIELGKTYPQPCLDLKEGRLRALAGYQTMKSAFEEAGHAGHARATPKSSAS